MRGGGDNDGLRAFWWSEACGERRAFWRMNGGGHPLSFLYHL